MTTETTAECGEMRNALLICMGMVHGLLHGMNERKSESQKKQIRTLCDEQLKHASEVIQKTEAKTS